MVVIAPYVLHRHRRLWDRPDVFRPERFLPEERGRIDRFRLPALRAGPRVCIGASFSLQEAVIVLATIAQNPCGSTSWRGTRSSPVQRITRPRPADDVPSACRMGARPSFGKVGRA
jgi:cytochrome P450